MAIVNGKTSKFDITTGNRYISGYVELTETYDDKTYTSTNKSTLTATAYLRRTNNYSGTPTSFDGLTFMRRFVIDGTEYKVSEKTSMTIPNNKSYVEIYRASKEIQHNSDGSKKVDVTFECKTSSGWPEGFTVSPTTGSIELTKILRGSVISNVAITIEANETIKITPTFTTYANFYNKLILETEKGNIELNGVVSKQVYTLNNDSKKILFDAIGTKKATTIVCTLKTYSDNTMKTQVGDNSSVNSIATLPTYSITTNLSVTDTITTYNQYKVNETDLIANLSIPKLEFNATSSTGYTYGRSIYFKNNNEIKITSPLTLTDWKGTNYSVIATDDRVNAEIKNITNTIIPYVSPTITNGKVERISPTSDQVTMEFRFQIYNGNGLNEASLHDYDFRVAYQEGNEGTVITLLKESFDFTETTSDNIITVTARTKNNIVDLDYKKEILYTATLIDKISNSTSLSGTKTKGLPVWLAYEENGINYFNVFGKYLQDGVELIESGTKDDITYIKFADGILIQYFSVIITPDSTRSSGGLTYYSGYLIMSLPKTFIGINYLGLVNVNQSNMNFFAQSYVAVESESKVRVSLATTEQNASRIVHALLIGRWK